MKRLLPVLALLLLPSVAAAESYSDLRKGVLDALKSEDPVVRARAFDMMQRCEDPRAVPFLIDQVTKLEREQESVRKQQAAHVEDMEKLFEKKLKADATFEASDRGARDMQRYNDAVEKLRKQMDAIRIDRRNLENDLTRMRAMIDSAVRTVSTVLSNINDPAAFEVALGELAEAWRGKDAVEALRWLDALGPVEHPVVAQQLRAAVADEDLPDAVRAATLRTLAERAEPGTLELAIAWLHLEPKHALMTAGAIDAIRELHQVQGIEPLIRFLGREDLKRLREDAHHALKSLTGETHGPYQDPWTRWYANKPADWQMPEASVPQSAEREQGTGVTFYGVHTFSDRILFILDVSGSMDQMLEPPSDPEAGMVQFFGKIKIDVARKELIGAINNLEGTDRFNVIFFNHEIVPWQTKVVEGTESNKRRVREWIEEQPPVGFTNIHDALEAGFRFATRVAGRPDVDTIFFLTDGRPTEGKLQDPEAILTAVAEWNRVAGATIHTIGVGDHDKDFMRRLAEMSKGQYVDLGPKDEPEDPDGN